MIEQGQLIQLVSPKGKRYLRMLQEGDVLQTHDGLLSMDAVREADFGASIRTHLGRPYRVVKPTIYDLVKGIKRKTQILYPKEIGYILMKLGVGPGTQVVECGTGSGSLTMALAWYVGDTGTVFSYERRAEFSELCGKNLEQVGLAHRVRRYVRDIEEGFEQTAADALFLDVRTPDMYIPQAAAVVKPGAPVGFLLPTTNQISDLLAEIEATGLLTDLEVVEILLRRYKPVSDRLRPEDRMVAHTGYLVFARNRGAMPVDEVAAPVAAALEAEEDVVGEAVADGAPADE